MLDLQHARHVMIERHIARRGVRDRHVLLAMEEVPRERFVEERFAERSYEDTPLPIGHGQTISQPFIVAMMIDAAGLEPDDRVLEIGAGSGYAAAVMSRIADRVFAIERHSQLADEARSRLDGLGYSNVTLICGDGSLGLPEEAPFDAIVVSAGCPFIPQALKDQLEIGGRLIIPVGVDAHEQRLLRVTRLGAARFEEEDLGGVRFVPLVGREGWADRMSGV